MYLFCVTGTKQALHLCADFEPATSEIAWVKQYAKYVSGFTKAMHAVGLQAEMCVSDWGAFNFLLPTSCGL